VPWSTFDVKLTAHSLLRADNLDKIFAEGNTNIPKGSMTKNSTAVLAVLDEQKLPKGP
jgi:hypothetical protein